MGIETVIKVIGLVDGSTTAFDGQFVVEFDASRNGVEPITGLPIGHLITTPDKSEAKRFDDRVAAFELWRSVDKRSPWRRDGKPNRPFTAFSVEIEPA